MLHNPARAMMSRAGNTLRAVGAAGGTATMPLRAAAATMRRCLATATPALSADYPRVDQFRAFSWGDAAPGADHVTFSTQEALEARTGLQVPAAGVVAVELAPADGAGGLTLAVNAGKAGEVTEESLGKAAAAAVRWLAAHKRTTAGITLPDPASLVEGDSTDADATAPDASAVAAAVARAAMEAAYTFPKYLTATGDDAPHVFESVRFGSAVGSGDAEFCQRAEVARARVLVGATGVARDLATDRGDVVTPAFMASCAEELAAEYDNVTTTVLTDDDLKERGMNLLAAVGQGAHREAHRPRLVTIEYRGNPEKDGTSLALVGKGITFDSGGLNLKPTGFMEDMHADMSGSAAVTAAMRAIAELNLPINVVAAMPFAENCVGAEAYKPHAIIKSLKGLTVEINNTDAEGRLALVDAMTHVQKTYNPPVMVDIATLTGACVVALGEYVAGVFGNDSDTLAAVKGAGATVQEPCWEMPILKEHTAELKSKIADSRSTGTGRNGGASTAAAFLQQFVEDGVKWAHVDIAGPAMPSKSPSGGYSGFGAQLLTQLAVDMADSEE